MTVFSKINSLIELPVRVLGPIFSTLYENLEARTEYNFRRERIHRQEGVSCMIRAKNEEKKIIDCLISIEDVFDEIIFIDNGSDDNTLKLVKEYSEHHPRISVYSYNVQVSKCGSEHNSTEEKSIHSLSYYYNWCASKCSYSYICKWDADMILDKYSKDKFKSIIHSFSSYWPTFASFEVQTIYKFFEKYYLAKNEVNSEIRIFPNRSDVKFIKGDNFELLDGKIYKSHNVLLCDVKVYECKDASENEFSHWTETKSFPTKRKQIEFENFLKIKEGNIDSEVFTEIVINIFDS
ncbi:glycosyltransferase family 2 protein [Vibrio salinus]|uniref:glycosyltransferase family 2 protein n=1 Tax=Vibrio salinus TaxID=2899784 RepID=UPI001E44DB85|nr:glycosyltransferase [Vibrio salinus]MCE0495581.1 glycosyltransferase [Vibrio salinus]